QTMLKFTANGGTINFQRYSDSSQNHIRFWQTCWRSVAQTMLKFTANGGTINFQRYSDSSQNHIRFWQTC
ncbi:hypothetical protein R3X46_25110, partial [Salmonella enterica subsp. enterica serovar Agona]|uniref:hypothetical protein n=1 Tax=Salmonella enterica TaxID=28901 RepID=UPI002A7654F6